ncbi:MAG TPA: UbiA prenyltransferase family protein [Candidatus Saccharimonadales bacterium]|nr:UbiA prenyltransferase family protein [Candidatus Saccharimonadales bacterium]
MRTKHYLKNVLVFLPLVFGGYLLNEQYLMRSIYSFLAFSFVASAVYVVNDLNDRHLDALHPKKKYRPIAAGEIGVPQAIIFAIMLLLVAAICQYFAHVTFASVGFLVFYFVINIFYSFGLKNIPIVDVAILSLGFVVRVLYGGSSVGIEVSKWLYLAILAFSFYLSLGKRRNEIRANGFKTRKVNKFYTQEFLDKNMYVCLGLTIVYYSLWAIDPVQTRHLLYLTIPLVIIIAMAYSLTIEGAKSDGDPVSVLLGNRPLMALVGSYGILMLWLMYR